MCSKTDGRHGNNTMTADHRQLGFLILCLRVAAAGLLVGMFGYAGIVKLMDPVSFYEAILRYRIVEGVAAWWGAHFLASVEVITAMALCLPVVRRGAAGMLGGLLLVFTAVSGSAAARGIELSCGCFGESAPLLLSANSFGELLMRNLFLLVCAGAIFWHDRDQNASYERCN